MSAARAVARAAAGAAIAAVLVLTPACDRAGEAPPAEQRTALAGDAGSLARGQEYTRWLYAGDYGRLWERFTPELRRDFGSVDSLGVFARRTLEQLGDELGPASERVAPAADQTIYTRTASFARAAGPMMLQWTIDAGGMISGFFLRPVPADSVAAAVRPR